jgi:hypothetical protein
MASELEEVEPVAVDEGDAATAEYDAEGSVGPALDESAPEDPESPRTGLGPWGDEPDNDSPVIAENRNETKATASETNEKTESAG